MEEKKKTEAEEKIQVTDSMGDENSSSSKEMSTTVSSATDKPQAMKVQVDNLHEYFSPALLLLLFMGILPLSSARELEEKQLLFPLNHFDDYVEKERAAENGLRIQGAVAA